MFLQRLPVLFILSKFMPLDNSLDYLYVINALYKIIHILHKKYKNKLDTFALYMIEFAHYLIEYEDNWYMKNVIISK